jgi:hypothetical protein
MSDKILLNDMSELLKSPTKNKIGDEIRQIDRENIETINRLQKFIYLLDSIEISINNHKKNEEIKMEKIKTNYIENSNLYKTICNNLM